jgi:hypothetical protein
MRVPSAGFIGYAKIGSLVALSHDVCEVALDAFKIAALKGWRQAQVQSAFLHCCVHYKGNLTVAVSMLYSVDWAARRGNSHVRVLARVVFHHAGALHGYLRVEAHGGPRGL